MTQTQASSTSPSQPAAPIHGAPSANTGTEQAALAALGSGDTRKALTILMDAYGSHIHRYCVRMVRNAEDAQDLLQTTFVNAYRDLPRFRGGSSLKTWLFGIARHRCLDALRARQREEARHETLDETPVDPSPSPLEPIVQMSLAQALQDCLAELPAQTRDTILLRYVEGLTYPEIAKITGAKAATLQIRVARALPKLKSALEQRGQAL